MKKEMTTNKILRKRSELGDRKARYKWALNLMRECNKKHTSLIIKLLRSAVEAEIHEASYELALFYESEWNLQFSNKKALKWYQYAANKGVIAANNQLAVIYEGGVYVRKNLNKAISLYKKGAIAGDVIAQFNLAQNYESGIGVKKSIKEALRWYKLSMLQGFDEAEEKFNALKKITYKKNLKAV